MEKIELKNIVPDFFPVKRADDMPSDIWDLSSITLDKGEKILLRGGSGSGKTSLLNFICGFRADFSGEILYDGRPLGSFKEKEKDIILQRNIGILFQDMRLFPRLTSLENVMIKAGITGDCSEEKAVEMLERVGLGDKLETPVANLSIGQQQRVAFVRMMAQKADFWIMDEPVSHIDDINAGIMAQMLMEETEVSGAAVIASSVGRDFPISYTRTLQL